MAVKSLFVGFHNFVRVLCLLFIRISADLCPAELAGRRCDCTCIPNPHSLCQYTPTYPVWFWPNGTFKWIAAYRDGSAVEIGNGAMLALVKDSHEAKGSWKASWYGGNHYNPDVLRRTNCACYYAHGVGKSWELANYGIAKVQNSSHLTVESVCKSFWTDCPKSNDSAFERWGPPFIERYVDCQLVDAPSPIVIL
mmetsp:Transcript_2083/g.4109  ORF Transcript_2083/g.4109 Transcript_2083/m.4109 type:complete len:195 (-) Transcript_2083:22-606(-)